MNISEGSSVEMEMMQIKGVDSTVRVTTARLEKNARLVVREKLMTLGLTEAEEQIVNGFLR